MLLPSPARSGGPAPTLCHPLWPGPREPCDTPAAPPYSPLARQRVAA